MTLKDNISLDDVPGNFVSILTVFNVDNPMSIVNISTHCIGIYGANNVQEGASLALYNTQFKVVKAKQFFKIYFNFSRLWVIKNHILLAMGQNLSIVTFRVSKEQLSELIGSQVTNDINTLAEISFDFINEEDQLEEALDFYNTEDKIDKKEIKKIENYTGYKLNDILKKDKKKKTTDDDDDDNDYDSTNNSEKRNKKPIVANGINVPYIPYEIFENDFRYVINYKDFDIEYVQSNDIKSFEDMDIDLIKNPNFTGFTTKQIDIFAKELEKYGVSEQEITERLLFILLKINNINEMINCIRRYTLISERILAKVLKYALKNYTPLELIPKNSSSNVNEINDSCNEKNKNNIENNHNEKMDINEASSTITNKNEIKKKFKLLNIILSCSFDIENFPLYIRKELDFNDIFTLMQHLYNIFISTDNWLEQRPETCLDFDEDSIILLWLSLILNTHFQQLALSRDLKLANLLTNWLTALNEFKNDLTDLCGLSHLLYQLIECKIDYKEKPYSKWYSIEEVKLY